MKALTVKEPWASLIINELKEYEFRSWKTNYRGKILIHAGLSIEKEPAEKFKSCNIFINPGNIIGEAEITDCIKVSEAFDKELREENPLIYGNDHIDKYAWKLANIKKYENPVPYKGKLGLWECDNDYIKE